MSSISQQQKKLKVSVIRILSSSNFVVYLAKSQTDSKSYAMKVFPYADKSIHRSFVREISALDFDHKNVMKVVDYNPSIATEVGNQRVGYSSYVLMELAPYGDLADLIMSESFRRDDKLIRTLFHYVCEGVQHIHSKKFAHMDLKIENVLLGENFIPKVSDFDGLKNLSNSKNEIIARLGTVNCRAPEVIKQECRDGYAADLYSLGIMLIILQFGFLPYVENFPVDGNDFQSLLTESNPAYFKLHSGKDRLPSKNAESYKELVFGLTKKNPSKRMTFEDLKKNQWYNQPIYSESEYIQIMKSYF